MNAYVAAFTGQCGVGRPPPGGPNGYHQRREVLTSAGAIEVTAPRVNDNRTDPATGEAAVRFGDLAAVGAEDPKVMEGAAAVVSARAVQQGLCARAGPVPRILGGVVGSGGPEAAGDLEGRDLHSLELEPERLSLTKGA